jgi:hypothetical protein
MYFITVNFYQITTSDLRQIHDANISLKYFFFVYYKISTWRPPELFSVFRFDGDNLRTVGARCAKLRYEDKRQTCLLENSYM